MGDCPFCPIPPEVRLVREWVIGPPYYMFWGPVVAFEPLNPVTPGHLLVVPRRHFPNADIAGLTSHVMGFAAELARDLPSYNIITSKGAPASQTVPHFHVHVVPRHEGDGFALPWGYVLPVA